MKRGSKPGKLFQRCRACGCEMSLRGKTQLQQSFLHDAHDELLSDERPLRGLEAELLKDPGAGSHIPFEDDSTDAFDGSAAKMCVCNSDSSSASN